MTTNSPKPVNSIYYKHIGKIVLICLQGIIILASFIYFINGAVQYIGKNKSNIEDDLQRCTMHTIPYAITAIVVLILQILLIRWSIRSKRTFVPGVSLLITIFLTILWMNIATFTNILIDCV